MNQESKSPDRLDTPMVHVMTVHWRSDMWIDIQLSYLEKHISGPMRIYASLDELPRPQRDKYFFQTELDGSHPDKLDHLAQMILDDPETKESDWLLFVDGDAFPIQDVRAYGHEKLSEFPLVAVQRLENNNDVQPHPCFCLTTVGFWREIKGTWQPGYLWENAQGNRLTDVGGDLLGILTERRTKWLPMLRSNGQERHPVFFGLYENLVYHHGAGFRRACSRKSVEDKLAEMQGTFLYRLLGFLHRNAPKAQSLRRLRRLVEPQFWAKQQAIWQSQKISRQVFNMVKENDQFFLQL